LSKTRPPVTPEVRERQSAIAKARWADPIAGAKLRAALYSPASRAKMSESAKTRDVAARERVGSASKERGPTPRCERR
jgi:hypothetical protein